MAEAERNMIEELRELVRERRRFPIEAYLFLYQALDAAQRMVGEKRHVSGAELCEGFRRLAVEQFGPLALMVLNHWGMRRTDDVGEMVFNLVARDLMGKTDKDRLEDFDGVYDFEEAFAAQAILATQSSTELAPAFKLALKDLPGGRRSPA